MDISHSNLYVDQAVKCLDSLIISTLETFAESNSIPVYVLSAPLTERKYKSSFNDGCVLLIPQHKFLFVNCSSNHSDRRFEDYVEDTLEDVGSISDRFQFKEIIGRPRLWGSLYKKVKLSDIKDNLIDYLTQIKLIDLSEVRRVEIIISLFIGSINNAENINIEQPQNLLDSVKHKIQLFDCDQTRFIYYEPDSSKKIIKIQGLSGTGKTELLLHKLKDIYVSDKEAKIGFTCYSKVLADTLKKRIPVFFDYMNVPQQIDWEDRLLCVNAWGQRSNLRSGIYRYICGFYQIPFQSYDEVKSFAAACKTATDAISHIASDNEDFKYAFQYIFIDESQDFQKEFFELCETVTEKRVYSAGDIFQSIYANADDSKDIIGDFLLNKCYRTDPKTFMIAQALGWGLFEQPKIRWLSESAWQACGYEIKKIESNQLKLSRKPLKRFDGESSDDISFLLVKSDDAIKDILEIIASLKSSFASLNADDICIIFLDPEQYIYELVPQIKNKVYDLYDWDTDVAYETKKKEVNKLFITNHRNAKGLEFPFVICYTKAITNSISYRNLLYTMISRSFLRTYFVIDSNGSDSITAQMKNGIDQILQNGLMTLNIPEATEVEAMKKQRLAYCQTRSLKDRLEPILIKYDIPMDAIVRVLDLIKGSSKSFEEDSDLDDFVSSIQRLGLL